MKTLFLVLFHELIKKKEHVSKLIMGMQSNLKNFPFWLKLLI